MAYERWRHRFAETEVLFRQGDPGDCAYVVESGSIEISVDLPGGRQVLDRLGPGAVLGEMALVDSGPRMATATAVQATVVRILTRDYLVDRMALADPLLRHILQLVVARYRDVIGRIDGIAQLQPPVADPAPAGRDQVLAMDRLLLDEELELALEQQQFLLHFQPIISLHDRAVAGFEALIRWIHPQRGLLLPDAFIPAAEQSDLIVRIGRWVIEAATRALARLNAHRPQGSAPLFMAVNLSGRQFADTGLVGAIEHALDTCSVAPGQLRLEITESMLLNRLDEAAELMHRCAGLGVKLTVDDFGTGYSALSYLYRLPVSGVKLAAPFVRDIAGFPASKKVMRAVARVAHDLAMDTVAEGIETPGQAEAVTGLGIPYGQGFHFASGMPLLVASNFTTHRHQAQGYPFGTQAATVTP